jgi:hypothetical protein
LVVADVVADGHDPAEIVGEAEHFQALLRFVFQLRFAQRALAEVFGHVRSVTAQYRCR